MSGFGLGRKLFERVATGTWKSIPWRDVWAGAGSSGLLFLLGNHLIDPCEEQPVEHV
jgi:hypothetical protein